MYKKYPLISIFLLVLVLTSTFVLSDDKKKEDFWLPMEERVKTWDAVVSEQLSLSLPLPSSKPYTIITSGREASFEKGGIKWTIVGANAPIVNPTVYPKDWPVKGNDFEVLVIPEPITNYKILPFTEKIENAVKSDTISITAAPDSYEPASFVIRSGDGDLKDVMIEVTDLKAERKGKDGKKKTVTIPKENIDVRVVKCWYQAGVKINDVKHKILTPELLIHDDDIVKVDYDRQLNLLRNLEKMQDAEKLKSFNIPKNQNKQVWFTLHIKKELHPGNYKGAVKILQGKKLMKRMKFNAEVLPFILPDPMLDYVLYYYDYLGYHTIQNQSEKVWKLKSNEQSLYELIDMKEHGLTNATVWHQFKNTDTKNWAEDLNRLKQSLELRREIGWGSKPLLYLDLKNAFKSDLKMYKNKIEAIIELAKAFDIQDVYIYGVDEKSGKDLFALRSLYQTVHEAGAKNFVACDTDFIVYVPDLLDLPVLGGNPDDFFMGLLNKLGMKIWNYSFPQAGIEEPETYRINYGLRLVAKGFSGACDFTYQEHWDDFVSTDFRSHTMAYSTINRPIPTIQWEGWREGINDIRYVTLMKNYALLKKDWLNKQCLTNVCDCREKAIKILADYLQTQKKLK
jgi:hypothetical protein